VYYVYVINEEQNSMMDLSPIEFFVRQHVHGERVFAVLLVQESGSGGTSGTYAHGLAESLFGKKVILKQWRPTK
jgi:hypothetical protein